jgi:outer membrane protein TolC
MRLTVLLAWILTTLSWVSSVHAMTFEEALRFAGQRPSVGAPTIAAGERQSDDNGVPGRVGNPEMLVGLGPGTQSPGFRDFGVELQATLTVPIALHDVGGDRRRSVAAERSWLAIEQQRRALEQRRDAARAWITLHTAESLLRTARIEAETAQELATQLTRAVGTGAAITPDALEATLAAEEQRTRVIDAEGNVAEAAAALSLATGVMPIPRPTTEGEVPSVSLPPPSEWEQWVAAASALPDVQAQTWMAHASQLLAEETAGAGTSWLTVGGQVQRNSSDQYQIYALVGARWSAFDRNQRSHARAVETARLAAADAVQASARARVMMAVALHDVAHEREAENAVRTALLPAAERLVLSREQTLRQGVGTVFDLLRARSMRLHAQSDLITREGARLRAELDAWMLISSLQRAQQPR